MSLESPLPLPRALHYAASAGSSQSTLDGLEAFLRQPLTRAILALPDGEAQQQQGSDGGPEDGGASGGGGDPVSADAAAAAVLSLDALLVNDAYKPRMHKLYARYFSGVVSDFELAVRRTPLPLAQIRGEDPELWAAFEARCARCLGVQPYPPAVAAALNERFPGFRCSQGMLGRGEQHGVAPITWQEFGGQLVAFSHGPIEASSHVETTLTQLVQQVTIEGQVRRLERQHGIHLSPAELLANSLGKLAAGVQRLAEGFAAAAAADGGGGGGGPPPGTMLFAGRRSTSRRFLLLQNWYCMQHLPGYLGTSSVLAVTLLGALHKQLQSQQQQHTQQSAAATAAAAEAVAAAGEAASAAAAAAAGPAPTLRLAGTLAHEVMMVTDQLLGSFNDLPPSNGSSGGSDHLAQISPLLAHLLLLAAGGGLAHATALCDTFGTRGFVSAALAAAVPDEWRQDMQRDYPDEWAALPAAARAPGARVFDLFSTWRMDSGDYSEMATVVADAWERRWVGTPPEQRPPPPAFMHSNLESWDEIVGCARLPRRIRPTYFAFGTLADGFLPFDPPFETSAGGGGGGGGSGGSGSGGGADGGGAPPLRPEVKLCSVVMKAVQSRCPGSSLAPSTESAGKIGDDANAAKMQFDKRLPPDAVERTRQRLLLLSAERTVDAAAASSALVQAYHAVTRDRVLCC